jgi:hypothetical protein
MAIPISVPFRNSERAGRSFILNNGITISPWQGVLDTEDQQELKFKGRA